MMKRSLWLLYLLRNVLLRVKSSNSNPLWLLSC